MSPCAVCEKDIDPTYPHQDSDEGVVHTYCALDGAGNACRNEACEWLNCVHGGGCVV